MPGSPALSKLDPREATLASNFASAESIAQAARRRPAEETVSLGRYVITGRIASGGMATVYSARLEGQGGFAREFALKVIHPHLADAEGFKDRFLDEARIASRVNHPNVVATVDSDQDRGYHFLVLELVDGVTLRQLQVKGFESVESADARLAPAEAALIVCDAARGLHAVHTVVDEHGVSLDVVHRDLSPHNLMLDVTGRTVLIDLGLAKARGQLGHTQTGVLCGKLPYMSPEQSRVQPLDARSDVFSLGSVLFELAVGEAPFGDDHTPGTLDALRTCDTDRLAGKLVDAEIPSWLTRIVLACLRRDPDDRYASAAVLADALDEAMRRASVVESAARENLAQRAQAVRRQLGPEQPAEPLPPLITADPTGPHQALDRELAGSIGGARVPGWLRGLGMASVGALLMVVGLYLVDTLSDKRTATASDQLWQPSLASDANAPIPAPSSLTNVAPAIVPLTQPSAPPLDADQTEASEAVPEPARKRKSAASRKLDPLGDFKRNPYD